MEPDGGANAPIEQTNAGGFGSAATSAAKQPILQPADSDDEYPRSLPDDVSVSGRIRPSLATSSHWHMDMSQMLAPCPSSAP